MLLRAFVCARNKHFVMEMTMGKLLKKRNLTYLVGQSLEKKRLWEKGDILSIRKIVESRKKIFMDICKLEEFLFVLLEIWRCLFEVEERKNY